MKVICHRRMRKLTMAFLLQQTYITMKVVKIGIGVRIGNRIRFKIRIAVKGAARSRTGLHLGDQPGIKDGFGCKHGGTVR